MKQEKTLIGFGKLPKCLEKYVRLTATKWFEINKDDEHKALFDLVEYVQKLEFGKRE